MPSPLERRPLASMESREPRSIRFGSSEWGALVTAARARGLEPAAFVRDLALMALMIVDTPHLMEAHLKNLAVLRTGSQPQKLNGAAAQ